MTKIEKVTVWGSTAVMSVTGVAMAWMEYLLQPADSFAVINHPWQPALVKLHILSAPVMVFGIGMIFMRHIWPHFRAGLKKGRRSGIWSMLLTAAMILTGYALQVLSHSGWLTALGYVHFALGTAFAAGGAIHFVATNRQKRRATKSAKSNADLSFPAERRRVAGL